MDSICVNEDLREPLVRRQGSQVSMRVARASWESGTLGKGGVSGKFQGRLGLREPLVRCQGIHVSMRMVRPQPDTASHPAAARRSGS